MKHNLLKYLWFPAAGAIVLLAGSSARADYSSTVQASGPAGYWRFSETAVSPPMPLPAVNLGSAGSANNGSYNGGFTRGLPAAMAGSTATYFTGGAWVSVPNSPTLNPNAPFSVEFWIKPTLVQGALTCPVSSTDFGTPRLGWLFYTDNGYSGGYVNGGYYFRVYNSVGTTSTYKAATSPAGTLTTNWTHVVGVVDGTSVLLYINGQQVASTPWNGTFSPNVNQSIGIGTRYDTGFPQDGSMSDVAIYGSALSAGAIAAHFDAATTNAAGYAAQIQALNPVGYWRLNEAPDAYPVAANTGSLAAAANGNYLYWSTTTTELDSPTFPGFAANNTVLQPSGTNGHVAIPALNLNTNTVTMEGWIKRNGNQSSYAGILFHRGGGGTATGIMFRDTSNEIGYHWNDQYYGWASGLTPPDGAWAYIALAVSPDQAVMYIYDGTAWASAVNVAAHGVQAFAATTRVGSDNGTGRFFNGLMDEMAIYNRTLSEGELRTHALAGFGDPAHSPPTFVYDPPTISPAGTIYATTPFTLTADAYGEPPLTFQWQKDGVDIVGATNRAYTKAVAATSDNGSYVVVVRNNNGSTTSTPIALTVNSAVPPTITNQPLTRVVYSGGTASFTVGADGTTPFSYQWQHAGTNLPGATNATLIVANCTADQTGTYRVGVTNVAGGVLSSPVTLTLRVPAANSYEATVVGDGPIAYWRLGEAAGTTAFNYASGDDGVYHNATLGQPGFSPFDPDTAATFGPGTDSYVGGIQNVSFTGSGGSTTFSLEFWAKGLPSQQLGDGAFICKGTGGGGEQFCIDGYQGRYRFYGSGAGAAHGPVSPDGTWQHVVGVCDGPHGQWLLYVNGIQVASGTPPGTMLNTTHEVTLAARQSGSGSYDFCWNALLDEVAIYKKALTADQVMAHYAAGAYGAATAPFVTANPGSQTVVVGKPVTLTGAFNGSRPISYQWKKDGVNVPGATSAALNLASPYFTDAGSYVLWATNGAGYASTTAATLTVMPTPGYANQTNDLVLHLRFDGDYQDTCGLANNAYAVGQPPFVTGKVGQAVHIASAPNNNYLQVIDTAEYLSFYETNSFTVGFWIKYTDRFNDVPIIGNAVNSTYQLGWVFTDEGGKLEWSLVSTANSGTYLRDPVPNSPVIGDGAWHHVLGVVDRDQQLALAYIDGNLASSWSIAGLGALFYSQLITIGSDPTGAYGSATFDMDDLGIWRRALNSVDAAGIYAAGQSGVSFDAKAPIKVYVNQVGTNVDVSWQAGTLLQSSTANGQYTAVPGATAPFYRTTATGSAMFFRVQQ